MKTKENKPEFKVGDMVNIEGNIRKILRIDGEDIYLQYGDEEGVFPLQPHDLTHATKKATE